MFKYSHVPAYSFSKSQKKLNAPTVPGPGAYEPAKGELLQKKHDVTSVKMKPSHAPDFSSKIRIGPGQYNIPDDNWRSPAASFPHAERSKAVVSQVPGPGQYNPDSIAERLKAEQRNVVFPKADRVTVDCGRKQLPGPGQYNCHELNPLADRFRAKSGYRFDKSKRDGMYPDRKGPGPGAYEAKPESVLEGTCRGYSLGKFEGRGVVPDSKVPGPGTYNAANATSCRNIKFGKNERGSSLLKKSEAPGPGQYEPERVFSKLVASPGVKFSKSETKLKASAVPGPGNYEVKGALEKRGVPFLKEQKHKLVVNDVPGPGTYDQTANMSARTGQFKFDKDKRSKECPNQVPGPGAYQPRFDDKQVCFKVAKEKRLRNYETAVPGPGQYNYDPKLWDKHFPKFGAKHYKENKGLSVAPGTYDIPPSIPDVPKYNYPSREKRKIKL